MIKQFFIALPFILSIQIVSGQFKNLTKYIPKNYTILDKAYGDINKDGITDLILILKSKSESFDADTLARPLLLLKGNGNKLYKLIARNDSVVLCSGCGGLHGDPYKAIKINKNNFSITHFGGSGWRWTRVITFKLNKKLNQFVLYNDGGLSWHISNPKEWSKNIFNREDFGTLPFTKFSYSNTDKYKFLYK